VLTEDPDDVTLSIYLTVVVSSSSSVTHG
jgi:hypothetical protein